MPGFSIRKNDKGTVIFYDNMPLVARKGLFAKIAGYSFKLEEINDETLKEIVRIALQLRGKKDEQRAIDMINKLGETQCFIVNRGYKYDTIAKFEKGLCEL